jgi:hypothetical protein
MHIWERWTFDLCLDSRRCEEFGGEQFYSEKGSDKLQKVAAISPSKTANEAQIMSNKVVSACAGFVTNGYISTNAYRTLSTFNV